MKVNKSCILELKKTGAPVVIVACIIDTEAIINSCNKYGIEIDAICDNEIRKCGHKFMGIDVIHTPNLVSKYKDIRFIIGALQIKDSCDQLSLFGYDKFYSPIELLKEYNYLEFKHSVPTLTLKNRVDVFIKVHETYFDKDKNYMRSLDVMITERCSLKCKSCSNLMQYYTNPKNVDQDKTIKALDILRKYVSEISEFRIIGGEPLMNKNWHNIIKKIQNYYNGNIIIYTNGTISPKDECFDGLNKKNIRFLITEYGNLSRNLNKLKNQLEKFNIEYTSTPAGYWVDCSNVKHHKRSKEKLAEVFRECCAKYTYTILNEKLYRCPFIANADNLKAIPDDPSNYVNLLSDNGSLEKRINKLINVYSFFPACDFCDGRPYDPTTKKGYDGKGIIEAGVQTKSILPYKSY
jgi:organic radical activating enzyme